MECLQWATDLIKIAIEGKFTGNITFNFFQGGITNINREESIKPNMKWRGGLVGKPMKDFN